MANRVHLFARGQLWLVASTAAVQTTSKNLDFFFVENEWQIKSHLFFIWFCLITLALFNLENINMKVIGSFKSPSSVGDIFTSIDWVKLAMLTISLQCWSVSLIWKFYCQTILISGKLRDTYSGFVSLNKISTHVWGFATHMGIYFDLPELKWLYLAIFGKTVFVLL